ncbi:MAG: TolC family protein [Chitinophagaceae bacterium]|nr:MAG: TolC family protein [Chitinophagaceae bacterium]
MFKTIRIFIGAFAATALLLGSCKVPAIVATPDQKAMPSTFGSDPDTTHVAATQWRQLFTDPYLVMLIDTALKNNQELLTTLQEIEIAKNDTRVRRAQILPNAAIVAGAGVEKVGRYTSQGAGDATTEIKPGKEMPDPLPDFMIGVVGNWEADIWNKLHTANKAAVSRYLATVEGTNFVKSNLVAEVANSYFELVALDHQLAIVKKNIGIQENALEIVKIQKDAARATELGVKKFEAEVFRTRSLEFDIHQQITVTENRINFLLARYPQAVTRDTTEFMTDLPTMVKSGIPSQLLENRPDIRQAELELEAAKLDVKVARAEFYPSLGIRAGVGFQAFKPAYLFRTPESLLYSLAGELAQPLINRTAIRAEFSSASARQLQALYNYQKTVLNAYFEVANELSGIDNLGKDYDLKLQQVAALNKSIEVSLDLFKYARADYFEVLMTQRDVLEAKLELVETRQQQFNAIVNVYRGLGGGWQ